jgi:hypothetical protein
LFGVLIIIVVLVAKGGIVGTVAALLPRFRGARRNAAGEPPQPAVEQAGTQP